MKGKFSYFILSLMSVAIALLNFEIVYSETSDTAIVDGKLNIRASSDVIAFPSTILGLVFDSTECENCRQNLPDWRFISNLKVDSIIYRDSTTYFSDSTGLSGVQISNTNLKQVFDELKAFRLKRNFRRGTPGDTLRWNDVRKKWVVIQDYTEFYEIEIPTTVNIDSAVNLLESTQALKFVERVPKIYPDGCFDSLLVEPWYPDDSMGWHLRHQELDGSGGVSAFEAWGQFDPDDDIGNVTIAIWDGILDTTHEDLNAHTYSEATVFYKIHGMGVAGIAAAIGNNGTGITGLAPTATIVSYSDWEEMVDSDPDVIIYAYHFTQSISSIKAILEEAVNVKNIPIICSSGDKGGTAPPYVSYPSYWDSLTISVGFTNQVPYSYVHAGSNYQCDTCSIPFCDGSARGIQSFS